MNMYYFEKIKQNKWEFIFLVLIIGIGIFLRTYHFSDWLHFEIDQSYDIDIVSRAVDNGIANLPLLGPNAGGGSLRLGPAFYYLEYIFAMIFGNTPPGHASCVLFFSIAALPLFYLFCRRYFRKITSLGLLAVFSFSFYNVMYSRFSWSPNVLPFLTLLSFYALLRSVSPGEKKKNLWFLVAVTVIAITTQIHFNAFFTVPAIAIIFLIILRPRFKIWTWLLAVVIILLIYSPVIFNDIKTNGENLRYFTQKMDKSTGGGQFFIPSPVIQDAKYNLEAYFFIISGQGQIDSQKPDAHLIPTGISGIGLIWYILGAFFLFTGIILAVIKFFQTKDKDRKNFLLINILWFFAVFAYFYSLTRSYRLYPRFYLLVVPLAVIFLGLILELIKPQKNKTRLAVFSAIIILLSFSHLRDNLNNFQQLKNNSGPYDTGDVFPITGRITLQEQMSIVDYVQSKYDQNHYPVYIDTYQELDPSFWYLLNRRGIAYWDEFRTDKVYQEGNYFLIGVGYKSDIKNAYNLAENKNFGRLMVSWLTPQPQAVTAQRQNPEDRKSLEQTDQINELITWKKLFKPLNYNSTATLNNPYQQSALDVFKDDPSVNPPFPMNPIMQPVFPNRTCNITDYGAVPDGKTKNTQAINQAITDCSQQGGGQVLIPAGTWLTGAIWLKSNIDLHLDAQAQVLFSTDPDDYLPAVFTRYEGVELYNYSPLIYARNATNIAITGAGTLNGQGEAWNDLTMPETINKLYDMGNNNIPVEQRVFGSKDNFLRPPFIQFINSNSILLEDFTVEDGPMWTINPTLSQNIVIRHVAIHTSVKNGDGIDVDSSQNVLIENSDLDTNDDSIVLKSGKGQDGLRVNQPTENVIIRNNSIQNGHGGIAIGSEIAGGVKNVFAYNCQVDDNQYGLRVKAMSTEKVDAENVWFQNIKIENAGIAAIDLDMNYGADPSTATGLPYFNNINFSDISGDRNKLAINIAGLPDNPVQNINFHRIAIGANDGSTFSYVNGLMLDGIDTKDEPVDEPVFTFTNTESASVINSQCSKIARLCVSISGDKTQKINLNGFTPNGANQVFLINEVNKNEVTY